MQDQIEEQEQRQEAEETGVSQPQQVQEIPQPHSKKMPGARILVPVALCVGLLCGSIPTGLYFNSKLDRVSAQEGTGQAQTGQQGQSQQQVEETDAVDRRTIRELLTQYGLSISFLQQLFPQQYVYTGAYGVCVEELDPALTQHSYDWSGVGEADGRYTYTAPDGTQALLGVDVSAFSGDIDWQAVKNDGISYAIIRMGFRGYGESGKLVMDENFHDNIQGAIAAGLDVGVYFFSQAITVEEAVEEAEYVLDAMEGYNVTYPVVYDLESIDYDTARTDNLTVDMATQVTRAFCERVAQEGYHPMIYGNVAWVMDRIDLAALSEFDLWLAQYQKAPTFPYQFEMWQYSHEGEVAGIEGSVDMNLLLTPFGQKDQSN